MKILANLPNRFFSLKPLPLSVCCSLQIFCTSWFIFPYFLSQSVRFLTIILTHVHEKVMYLIFGFMSKLMGRIRINHLSRGHQILHLLLMVYRIQYNVLFSSMMNLSGLGLSATSRKRFSN